MDTPEEVLAACLVYKDEEEAFAKIVEGYLKVTGDKRSLADECECAISTVPRWASGVARPGRHVRAAVVKRIAERVQDLSAKGSC